MEGAVTSSATVSLLRDSSRHVGDPAALRAVMREDGYVFLPGLLSRDRVASVRADYCEVLSQVGWLSPGTDPLEARPGPVVHRHVHEDLGWYDGYVALQRLESFHELAHDPSLTTVVAGLVDDETVVVHPLKIARVTFPGSDCPTPAHQDFFFIPGSPRAITAWVPLGDYAQEFGGLQVLPASHRDGVRPHVPQPGAGGSGIDVDPSADWHGTDYGMGDVLLFSALTCHRAPPNGADRLRLSADYRYQSLREPLLGACLEPHERPFAGGTVVPGWDELTADWSSLAPISVPEGVVVMPDPRIARGDPRGM